MQACNFSYFPQNDDLPLVPEHTQLPQRQQPPAVDCNPDTEALFAAELAELSMKERDVMLQDIHGVSDVLDEDPKFVQQCFDDLEEAILLIPAMDKIAYLRAREMDEKYVLNEAYLLMFLRADSFDVHAAASRMVAFFDSKMELFGPDKLTKDITYADLDEDDIQCLESGYAQILSSRDRAGRIVLCLMPMIRRYKTLQNKLRATYMVIMHALTDVETQQTGMVGLAYNVGRKRTQDRHAVWHMAKLVGTLPTKFNAVHYCYDDEKVKLLFSIAMFVWERRTRIRCRLHFGSDMECIYNLMTFGIPADVLPITPVGELKLEAHQEYCKRICKSNEVDDNVERIVVPGTYDILLGRGKPLQKHPGNLRYHHIVESDHDRYDMAQKLGKTNIAKLIVKKMKEDGARFLKQDKVGWVEIDDDAARYKVSHTFRNHRIAARLAQDKKKKGDMETNRRKHEDGSGASSTEECGSSEVRLESPPIGEPKKRRLSDASQSRSPANINLY